MVARPVMIDDSVAAKTLQSFGGWRVAEWTMTTTDEEIDAALVEARQQGELPRITEAVYHPEVGLDLYVLTISDGRRLVIPREELQAVAGATKKAAAEFTTAPLGSHLWWPKLDAGHHLSALLEHRYGTAAWMAGLERRALAV